MSGRRLVAILAAVFLLAWIMAVVFIVATWPDALHAWYRFSGANNEGGPTYGTWSGIAGATACFAWIPATFMVYRHLNCKKPGCLWLGHFPDLRGVKWCGRHHPDHGGRKPTMELLHRLHREHKQALTGTRTEQ